MGIRSGKHWSGGAELTDGACAAMGDFEAVGKAFVEHYYKTFDAPGGRSQLASLYQDQSMLTWEGQKNDGRCEHRAEAHLASVPILQAPRVDDGLPAEQPGRRCPGVRHRTTPGRRRAAPSQIQPGVPAPSHAGG